MKRIYTRGGDNGTTATHGGGRVMKTHPRIEAIGTLDELNTAIGMARTLAAPELPGVEDLREIQLTLMTLMSRVATPSPLLDQNPNKLPEGMSEGLEVLIDSVAATCSKAEYFILPGGTPAAAALHQARVTARRAERRLWALDAIDHVEPEILRYVNRLSDLMFVMARAELERTGIDEERWQAFTYRRVKGKIDGDEPLTV